MAMFHKISSRLRAEINTGFGNNPTTQGGRFINKDGRANIEKKGISFTEKISLYHSMLTLPRWKFFAVILLFYLGINLFFGMLYYLVGIRNLGLVPTTPIRDFAESFFFSTQTFTTVGYGRISPNGFLSSSLAALEALLGLLSLALATGLLYGRFAKPVAYVRFSHNAIIAPFKEINALMVRVAPFKNANLTEVAADLTMGITLEENGVKANKFYRLELEYSTITTLPLSWTIVHPINKKSPLYHFTREDFENLNGEIMVFIKAFDDLFSNIVVAKTSFVFREVIFGARFEPMFERSEFGDKTILYLDKLNAFTPAALNALESGSAEEISLG